MGLRLGELLVRSGVLTPPERDHILALQRSSGRPFGALAEEVFGVHPSAVEKAWSAQYAQLAPWVDPTRERTDLDALALVTRRQAWQFGLLPMRFEEGDLVICTTPENAPRALRFATRFLECVCCLVLSTPDDLAAALSEHYPMTGADRSLLVRTCPTG